MKKSTERLLAALAVILTAGILVTAVLSTGRQFGILSIGACSGGPVLVGQQIPFTDPDTQAKDYWVPFYSTLNCDATSYRIAVGRPELTAATGLDFGTGFALDFQNAREDLVYAVQNEKISIFNAAHTTGGYVPASGGGSVYKLNTPSGTGWGQAAVAYGGNFCSGGGWNYQGTSCYAVEVIWSRAAGVKGSLASSPGTQFSATAVVTSDFGQTISQTISSATQSIFFSLNNQTILTCTALGGLYTGTPAPSTNSVATVYSDPNSGGSGMWRLVTAAEWDNYETAYKSYQSAMLGGNYQGAINQIGSLNSAADQLFASSAALSSPGQFTSDGTGYSVRGAPKVTTQQIYCKVRGSFLGGIQPQGIPALSFSGVEKPPYHAGDSGALLFQASNTGNYSAGFSLAVACNGAALSPAQTFTIPEHGTVQARVPFNLANPGNYSCAGTLTDMTAGSTAQAAKAVFALAVQVCQPGLLSFVNARAVQQCKADGSGWEIALNCGTITETVKEKTCAAVAVVNLANASTVPGASPIPTPPGAVGTCTYDYTAAVVGTGAVCVNDEQVVSSLFIPPPIPGTPGVGIATCRATGAVLPVTRTYTYTSSIQYVDGKFTCAGGYNVPGASISSVSAPAPGVTPLPEVPAVVPSAPAPGAPGAPPSGAAPPPSPGFEAVFALAGLLAVAYLVNRRER